MLELINPFLIALSLTLIIAVICYYYRQSKFWNLAKSISSSSDPIYFIEKFGWASFSSRMEQEHCLRRAVNIGLISKGDYFRLLRTYYNIDLGWSDIIFIRGTFFHNEVEEIGFRFSPTTEKLTEIRLVYNNKPDFIFRHLPYNYDEKYETLTKRLNSYFKDWKDYVGIQMDDENKIYVTIFMYK